MATVTAAHRGDLSTLTKLAAADLSRSWASVDVADALAARDALMDTLPRLIGLYGEAATELGADYYDEMRDAAEVRGRFRAIPADLPDAGRVEALAGWGVGPLFGAQPDAASALTLITGGLQRIIANADRDTIRVSSTADPRGRGWRRVGTGRCSFCRMLIGRGAVYSEATAHFDSHDHCGCTAEPAF